LFQAPPQQDFILLITGETMIQIGDLVRQKQQRRTLARGVWLVIEEADWKVLCVQGSKRMWLHIDTLEKL